MWLQLSQIKKEKFTEGNARKLAFIWQLRWRQKNQKNTRGYLIKRALLWRHVSRERKQE